MTLMVKPMSWGYDLVLEDLDGFTYATTVPLVDAGDEVYLLPLNDVVRFKGTFDGGLVVITLLPICFAFIELGEEVSSSFTSSIVRSSHPYNENRYFCHCIYTKK